MEFGNTRKPENLPEVTMYLRIGSLAMVLAWAAPPADTAAPRLPAQLRIPVAGAETLAVSSEGEGPAILLLSGPIGSSYTWRHVTPALVEAGY